MKLVHKSGSIRCNPNKPASYGGCTNEPLYGNSSLMTIITNAKKELILPPAGDLQAHSGCNNKKNFYSINGSTHTSLGLVFRDLLNVASVSRKQEIQIWFGQDWSDCYETDNRGKPCIDVYAWYV